MAIFDFMEGWYKPQRRHSSLDYASPIESERKNATRGRGPDASLSTEAGELHMALASGKSVRWVADQLDCSSPTLTLKTYAHALREEEVDLSFAEFGGPKRHYAAPPDLEERDNENAPDLTPIRNKSGAFRCL